MYETRLRVFLLIMALGVVVLIARLAQLQLFQHESKQEETEKQLTVTETLATSRGQIRDRNGVVMANDAPCFDFCLDYRLLVLDRSAPITGGTWAANQVKAIAADGSWRNEQAQKEFWLRVDRTWQIASDVTGDSLNEIHHWAETVVLRVQAIRAAVNASGTPGRIAEEKSQHPVIAGLDEDVAIRLRERLPEMVGAAVQPSHRRNYPCKDIACHIVGLLRRFDAPPSSSAQAQRPLEERLNETFRGDLVGESGVEKLCEDLLRGRRGYRQSHRNGQVLNEVPPTLGQDIHLTIDVELQRELGKMLGRPGAVVIVDIATGEVLAAVSLPTYDLNLYHKDFDRLRDDVADLPLYNRAVGMCYPPGSTAKPLAAVAALSLGVITEATTYNCRGYYQIPGELRCDLRTGHGEISVHTAIQHSCNVFFNNVGAHMGLERLSDWFGRFGYADPPGTGLPEERAGVLPDPRRKQARLEALLLPIGQGKIEVTPLHVADAMAAIARGGEFRGPVLVKELADRQKHWRIGATPSALACVQDALRSVVNDPGGTGYNYVRDSEIEICGKTGTAQTEPRWIDRNHDGKRQDDEILRAGDTAWFAGFAPFRHPQLAFAVVVEYSDSHGATAAGPIALEAMRLCKKMGYLK